MTGAVSGEIGARDGSSVRTALIAGTRGSALARWQTDHVASLLRTRGVHTEAKIITTQGDVNLAERLAGKIEKGFFTAELEAELRAGTIDYAVHSLKDLPTRLPEDLDVVAVLERADAFDLLLVRPEFVHDHGPNTLPLKAGARVGTSSLRRDAMIRAFSTGLASLPLRGNVPTRLSKLANGDYDAIVLAAAGVRRLQLDTSAFAVFELEPRRWPPAPGQGSVAVEARKHDTTTRAALASLDHAASRAACETERAYLRVLEGGCTTPFACYAAPAADRVYMGRAGLNGEDEPWRAVAVGAKVAHSDGLAQLDASRTHDISEVNHVPLVRKV